jgi:electron transfer flavoprotein beta subunit
MKIIVCAKQIRHTYARTGTSPESHYICPEDHIYRVNPHDEAALELALGLKDKLENITVILLTLGPMIAEEEMRRCLAAGADDLYQINVAGQPPSESDPSTPDPLDQADPWVKSDLMARAVKELNADLALCGKASVDKGSGQVGALVAHRLDRPFVSAITDLSMDEAGGTVQVQRSAGRGVRELIECRLPAVFSVDLGTDLRMPTFTRRQWAEHYVPHQLDLTTDVESPKIVCTHRFQPRPRPKIVPAPDSRLHAYERIMQLLIGSTVEKSGEMLTGSPDAQVEGIIAFLQANGFLESDREDP